jgi:hypothetical protein
VLIQVLDFLPGGAAHERLVTLSKIKVINEMTVIVPVKPKNQMLHNSLPLDLKLLLIKRRNKESFEFTIHYHELEFKPEDLQSREIVDLYKMLRGFKDTPGRPQRKGSVPDADQNHPIPISPTR